MTKSNVEKVVFSLGKNVVPNRYIDDLPERITSQTLIDIAKRRGRPAA
jgi:hypothetical protein